jgi:hypothetical protein
MFKIKTPVIEFLTYEEDKGVIPEPYPALQYQQEWYKKLPQRCGSGLNSSTVKRCAPFMDAMGLGYIIPLAADVEINLTEEDGHVVADTQANYPRCLIGHHRPDQLGGEHPSKPSPTLKFSNYWAIKVPRGWSVLFIPPLNRPDPRFECFSGLVDCDKYFNFINFPFFMKDTSFQGVIKQGTPLVQAVPFKRSSGTKHLVGELSDNDLRELQRTEKRLDASVSFYKNKIWRSE